MPCQDKNYGLNICFKLLQKSTYLITLISISAGVVGISRANLNSISVNSPSAVIIKEESNVKPNVANIIVRQQGKLIILITFCMFTWKIVCNLLYTMKQNNIYYNNWYSKLQLLYNFWASVKDVPESLRCFLSLIKPYLAFYVPPTPVRVLLHTCF